ncbi:hypothetical protein FH972_019918 [Carpinus fangiana]|uniref:Uncharacterized protein n=1 Tax=Carpinus fangiana TaxID=176857 RepID=A0A5N6RS53_9ROSI|nr:hypothetical protein FH972_019918 [Carpinus fangiana]
MSIITTATVAGQRTSKKLKTENPTPTPAGHAKRKEKLGERITTLQQLVSPVDVHGFCDCRRWVFEHYAGPTTTGQFELTNSAAQQGWLGSVRPLCACMAGDYLNHAPSLLGFLPSRIPLAGRARDGMAFVFAQDHHPSPPGSYGSYLGLLDICIQRLFTENRYIFEWHCKCNDGWKLKLRN